MDRTLMARPRVWPLTTFVTAVAVGLLGLAILAVGVWLGSAWSGHDDQRLVIGRLTDLSWTGTKACLTPDGGADADKICGALFVPPGVTPPHQGDAVTVYVRTTPDGTLLVVHTPDAPG